MVRRSVSDHLQCCYVFPGKCFRIFLPFFFLLFLGIFLVFFLCIKCVWCVCMWVYRHEIWDFKDINIERWFILLILPLEHFQRERKYNDSEFNKFFPSPSPFYMLCVDVTVINISTIYASHIWICEPWAYILHPLSNECTNCLSELLLLLIEKCCVWKRKISQNK